MVVVENVSTQISVCAHMSVYVIVGFLDSVIVFKENYYQMTLDNDLNQCIMNKQCIYSITVIWLNKSNSDRNFSPFSCEKKEAQIHKM